MSFRSCFEVIYKYGLIVFVSCVVMATTASASDAQNYGIAKKIIEADKEVRDYQAAQVGGYGFIYDKTPIGDLVFTILLGIIIFGFIGLLLYAWIATQVDNYKDAQAKATKNLTNEERIAYSAWNNRRWRTTRALSATVVCLIVFGYLGKELYFEIKNENKRKEFEAYQERVRIEEAAKDQDLYKKLSSQRLLLVEIFENGKIGDFEIGIRNLEKLKIKFGISFDLILFRLSENLINYQDYLTFNCLNTRDALCEPLKDVRVVGDNVNKVTFIYCNDDDLGNNKPSTKDKLSKYVLTGFAIKYNTYEYHKKVVESVNKLGLQSDNVSGNINQVIIDDYNGKGNGDGLGYGIMRKIVGTKDLCVNI